MSEHEHTIDPLVSLEVTSGKLTKLQMNSGNLYSQANWIICQNKILVFVRKKRENIALTISLNVRS